MKFLGAESKNPADWQVVYDNGMTDEEFTVKYSWRLRQVLAAIDQGFRLWRELAYYPSPDWDWRVNAVLDQKWTRNGMSLRIYIERFHWRERVFFEMLDSILWVLAGQPDRSGNRK